MSFLVLSLDLLSFTLALVSGCQEEGVNLSGRKESRLVKDISSWEECASICGGKSGCNDWVWAHQGAGPYAGNCALMEGYSKKVPDENTISGTKTCQGGCEIVKLLKLKATPFHLINN